MKRALVFALSAPLVALVVAGALVDVAVDLVVDAWESHG